MKLQAINLNINFDVFVSKYGTTYPIGKLPVAPKKVTLPNTAKLAGAKCAIMSSDDRLIEELEAKGDLHSVLVGSEPYGRTTRVNRAERYPNAYLLKSMKDEAGKKIIADYKTLALARTFRLHPNAKSLFTKLYSDLKNQPIFNTFATNV
jgi:hypothetical protein